MFTVVFTACCCSKCVEIFTVVFIACYGSNCVEIFTAVLKRVTAVSV